MAFGRGTVPLDFPWYHTVDASEIRNNHRLDVLNPSYINGINYQPQLFSQDFWLPSTVSPGVPNIWSFSTGGGLDPPPFPPPFPPRAGRQIAFFRGRDFRPSLQEVKRTSVNGGGGGTPQKSNELISKKLPIKKPRVPLPFPRPSSFWVSSSR